MNDMDKDTLTELLYSEDVENKKLGVSFIKNNFKYPEYVYSVPILFSTHWFSFVTNEGYKCRLIVDILLDNFIELDYFSKEYIESFINALIDYNEECR